MNMFLFPPVISEMVLYLFSMSLNKIWNTSPFMSLLFVKIKTGCVLKRRYLLLLLEPLLSHPLLSGLLGFMNKADLKESLYTVEAAFHWGWPRVGLCCQFVCSK